VTNETPVVKLGDVRQWLREGDRFALENGTVCALARVPSPSAMNRVYATYGNTGGLLCNDEPVRLISPRWERVNIGDTMPTGTVVTNGHAVWETSGTLIGGTSYRLVRTRLATRKDVRKGMRVKGKRKDDGSTYEGLVTYVGAGGFTVDAAFTISLTTNCPDLPVEILAEAPEQGEHRVELTLASGPTVTGQLSVATPGTLLSAESREALEEFAAMTYEERQREYVVQPGRRHGKTAEQQARREALEALSIAALDHGWEMLKAGVSQVGSPPTEPAIAAPDCVSCRRPMGYGRKVAYHGKCGDCFGRWDSGFPNRPDSALEHVGMPESSTEPTLPLTPSARYHLNDDADAFGIPEYS
jgi:hypothetical protein